MEKRTMAVVLIVEDDTMNRDMLARRLSWEGYQVITAADGAQAVEIARAERPALILMDMGLPILDGWRATQQIRAMPEIAHIPIIALTAFALAEDRANAVRRFMRAEGAAAAQLGLLSFGEEKPTQPGQGEPVWALNRRVELVY